MGPLPKRKLSKARRGKRQSHLALTPPALTSCPQCHQPRLPHTACPTCGTYAGREVITVKETKRKPS